MKFVDKSESDAVAVRRIPCPLGDKCEHKTVDECDQYRQQLLEEEHRKTCGPDCTHFGSPTRGIPDYGRHRGESPAEYLKRTRGVK